MLCESPDAVVRSCPRGEERGRNTGSAAGTVSGSSLGSSSSSLRAICPTVGNGCPGHCRRGGLEGRGGVAGATVCRMI